MSIDISGSRERIIEFLAKQSTGVLATANQQGKPHAATVYFICDRQLNFYFITKKDTQKQRNLQLNPQAAIAISDVSAQVTVQAVGTVAEITDHSQLEWVFSAIWRLAALTATGIAPPPIAKLVAGGYVVYRLSAPTVRMATFNRVHDDPANQQHIFDVVATEPTITSN